MKTAFTVASEPIFKPAHYCGFMTNSGARRSKGLL